MAMSELSEWFLTIAPQMFNSDMDAVSVVGIDKDRNLRSVYWNCSPQDRALMIHALMSDNLMTMLHENAKDIRAMLLDNEEDDDDDNML